jgi:hypothetical protein
MDPTAQELFQINTLEDAGHWAGLRGTAADGDTALGSLLATLGADATTPLRTVAALAAADLQVFIGQWLQPAGRGQQRPPTAIERAQAGEMGRVIRIKLGVEAPSAQGSQAVQTQLQAQLAAAQQAQAQAAADLAQAQAGVISSAAKRKIKLRDYLGDTFADADEADIIDRALYDAGLLRYEVIYGPGVLPPPADEPTIEQFSAFLAGLKLGSFYVDYGNVVPHANRMIKKRNNLKGYALLKDPQTGLPVFKDIELYGPADYKLWNASFRLHRVMVIVADACNMGDDRQVQREANREVLRGIRDALLGPLVPMPLQGLP